MKKEPRTKAQTCCQVLIEVLIPGDAGVGFALCHLNLPKALRHQPFTAMLVRHPPEITRVSCALVVFEHSFDKYKTFQEVGYFLGDPWLQCAVQVLRQVWYL